MTTFIVFSPDPETAHIVPEVPPGVQFDAHRIVGGSGDPIHAICGAGFLPRDIRDIGDDAKTMGAPPCTTCWRKSGGHVTEPVRED